MDAYQGAKERTLVEEATGGTAWQAEPTGGTDRIESRGSSDQKGSTGQKGAGEERAR